MRTSSRTGLNRAPRLALAAAAVALAAGTPARADNLDAALIEHAPELIKYLRGHHVKNVGVLKFRVHKAGHPVSFKAGPINDNLPGRVEAALGRANPDQEPIGIVVDASGVAASHKLARYDNPAGQRALFGQKYRLAWGQRQVTPDMMLTGVVDVPADKKSVTVQIEAFGPNSPKQEKVVSFTVKTDRALLTDLNESFSVKARSIRRARSRSIDLDAEAVADAAADDGQSGGGDSGGDAGGDSGGSNPPPTSGGDNAPASDLLSYQILYDGQPQQVTSDPSSGGEFRVAEPRASQVVTFRVKSLAPERIGLVLMVNGKSTLYEEEGDPAHLKAWVLDPGKEYSIEGFQIDNNTRKPFRVLTDEESAAATYGANTGLIQFHVMKSGGAPPAPSTESTGAEAAAERAASVSLRGLNRAALERAGATRSAADFKRVVRAQTAAASRRSRGLIAANESAVNGAIQNDEVKIQVLVQSIAVRYYRPRGQ